MSKIATSKALIAIAEQAARKQRRDADRPQRPTPERLAKPDMRPGQIAAYGKRGLLNHQQVAAANRLRRDCFVAEGGRVIGRLVASYGGEGGGRSSAGYEPTYMAGESRKAFDDAMAALHRANPEFALIVRHVVLQDQSAGSWAEARNLARSSASVVGIVTLRFALSALVYHYRGG